MAVHQSKHQSDLEKRLKILRQQFYGRESVAGSKQYVVREEETQQNTRTTNYPLREASQLPTTNLPTDITYLRADLMKISILAGTALGLQIILYFLIKNNILNINLF